MSTPIRDANGDELKIQPSVYHDDAIFVAFGGDSGRHILAKDLSELIKAMYRAAGQEPPLTLPRVRWYGSDRTSYAFNGVHVTREGKQISVLDRTWDATTARGVAAVLADMADAADAEPDPAALQHLSDVVDGSTPLARDDAVTIARAVLAAGYVRGDA